MSQAAQDALKRRFRDDKSLAPSASPPPRGCFPAFLILCAVLGA